MTPQELTAPKEWHQEFNNDSSHGWFAKKNSPKACETIHFHQTKSSPHFYSINIKLIGIHF